MKKKNVILEKTCKKGVLADKEVLLKFLNKPDTEAYVLKTGKYDDGKEFITIMIDNL
jgi:hypothetical protein